MPGKQRREIISRRERDGALVNVVETRTESAGSVPSHPAIREAFRHGQLERLWRFRLTSYVGPSERDMDRCDA